MRHSIIGPLVIIWVVLTILGMGVRLYVWEKLNQSIQTSAEAMVFHETLSAVSTSVQNAEAGQRCFLLTGQASCIAAYRKASVAIDTAFQGLQAYAQRDAVLQTNVLALKGLVLQKMDELQQTIEIRQKKGMDAAVALMLEDERKATWEKIRAATVAMQTQKMNFFSRAGEKLRQQMQQAHLTTLVTGLMGIGAGVLALYLFYVGHVQDKLQQQLVADKQRAERSAQEKTHFLANISHDIRTPMNAILGFSELLGADRLSPKQSQHVRSIRESAGLLLQLINDILDLSKIDAGKLELNPVPTDMQDQCRFLQTLFGQQAAQKALDLKFELDPVVPRALVLDAIRMRQVLVNLMGNAVKYTERGSIRMRIAWHKQLGTSSKGTLLVEVADTGAGISPEKLQDIFKPFVQGGSRPEVEAQGSGLGLTIVKRLTEAMNGTVAVESAVGRGSVFTVRFNEVPVSVRLPVSEQVEAEVEVDYNDFAPSALLIADDNSVNRKLLASIFEKTHHRLCFVSNGKEVLDVLAGFKPDVVLLDVRMPILDGRETLREIRSRPGFELLPVIAVTASSLRQEENEMKLQFNGYVRKPFSREALYRELAQFLPAQKWAQGRHTVQSMVPKVLSAQQTVHWQALTEELKRLKTKEWKMLHESLAINESKMFAQKLRMLAQAAQCEALMSYAEKLATQAEVYAVSDLERQLTEFPELVEAIEKRVTQSV